MHILFKTFRFFPTNCSLVLFFNHFSQNNTLICERKERKFIGCEKTHFVQKKKGESLKLGSLGGRRSRRGRSIRRGVVREELVLQNQRQNSMEDNHKDQDDLCNLRLSALQNWVHVPDQENTRDTSTNTQQDPSSQLDWDHREDRHRDPDRHGIPVEGKHLEEIRLASEVLCRAPDEEGDEEGVGVDGSKGKCHLEDVVLVCCSVDVGVDRVHNRRCHEQYKNYRCRNPERSCEICMKQNVEFGVSTLDRFSYLSLVLTT